MNFFKGETVLFSRDHYTVSIRFIEEQYQKFIILRETFLKLFQCFEKMLNWQHYEQNLSWQITGKGQQGCQQHSCHFFSECDNDQITKRRSTSFLYYKGQYLSCIHSKFLVKEKNKPFIESEYQKLPCFLIVIFSVDF